MTKFASFLRPHLEARQKQTGHHPDANLLLAFAEGALSGRERVVMLTHLAECPKCREVLALSSATGARESPQPVFSKASPTWWGWRMAATAAVICLVTMTVWRLPFSRSVPTAPPVKPVPSSPRPVPLPPVPLAPEAVQTETAKPKARVKHKPAPPQPEALTVMRPQSGIVASPAISPDLLGPKSMFSTTRDAAAQNVLQASSNSSKILWSLEASPAVGTVGKSEDGGRTWRAIPVDQGTRFYALSAAGADVWVGGAGGKLFHSADEGLHWTAIPVADDNASLAGAIVGIDARGSRVTLRTNSGATWTSDDGGRHWRR